MLRRLLALCLVSLSCSASALEPAARQLADQLLAMTGTAAVFDSAPVQAALADPQPFLGDGAELRRKRLLEDAGLRQWRPPRVWLLQSRREGEVEHWVSLGALYDAKARARGYTLINAAPLPSAEAALGFLSPGVASPVLGTLLGAYGADVLVLLRGQDWALWSGNTALKGAAPARAELLADVLAEQLAALQQWPEARGRPVIQVTSVARLGDMAGVQAALQALPGMQQLQLIRVGQGQTWFAVGAPVGDALVAALDGEPWLPAAARALAVVPAEMSDARRLACPLVVRQWHPDEAARPAANPTVPVTTAP